MSTAAVIRHARDHGGIDAEVVDTLTRLPATTFDSRAALIAAIRAVYLAAEVPASELPI